VSHKHWRVGRCNATSDLRFGSSSAWAESVRGGPRYVGMAVHNSQHAAFETRRVNIGSGAGKKVSGSRTNGPIHRCHHCRDAAYGGRGVFGRTVDVHGRFDGRPLQHTSHVGARWIFSAHATAAFYRRTIALIPCAKANDLISTLIAYNFRYHLSI